MQRRPHRYDVPERTAAFLHRGPLTYLSAAPWRGHHGEGVTANFTALSQQVREDIQSVLSATCNKNGCWTGFSSKD